MADDLDDFLQTHKRREGAMSHGDADKPAGSRRAVLDPPCERSLGADAHREHDYNHDGVRAAGASAFALHCRALQLAEGVEQ